MSMHAGAHGFSLPPAFMLCASGGCLFAVEMSAVLPPVPVRLQSLCGRKDSSIHSRLNPNRILSFSLPLLPSLLPSPPPTLLFHFVYYVCICLCGYAYL